MTARDRTVLIVLGVVAALGAFWFLAISPKRKEAADVSAQVSAAQQRLSTAQASATSAEAARKQYGKDYATVARLGKAVPVDDDMPSLVYQLETTAKANHVDFRSIKLTPGSSSSSASPTPGSGSASTVSSALPPGAAVGTAGFPTMPFSFEFNGSFFNMQRFVRAINGLTSVNGKTINVQGRLLTVDGIGLKASPAGFPDVDATVAVTAYLLPADEGLTAGATPADPSTGAASSTTTGSTATASLIGNN